MQARRIFDDCVRSLSAGAATVVHITDVFDLGSERVRQGAHLTHSVRAGSILSDLAMTALADCADQLGAPQADLFAALRALQQGIGLRLESGSIGYDAYLLQRVREAHEEGRRRLAREIHDHIGNSVSLALRQIELYELECEQAAGDSAPQSKHVDAAKEAILETIARSRELVSELRRPGVTGSLETALRGFAASLGRTGVPLQMWVRGSDQWIPGSVTEELFIMVRECLRNAYTHAGAANVVVHIDIAPHEVHAEIIDNGKGFDVRALRATGHGNGLLILQERSDLVGGTVNIDSAPGRGTRVTLWIPIAQERPTA
ncbi:signal transduction histidine kinase [Nocardia transvalensis]|uniref:Oxygen sensor histidine kinase NreB n=1 Tax=Nocardia transvalensis TaxID=37333 RepID=A0A7W9UGJ7_9NOCA|nr:ATP-binding protein [Nocardia transvalensis]MBB5912166.1 signal transduction histidine kinase [Nocardia transvalensis]